MSGEGSSFTTGNVLKFMPPGHFCPDVCGIEDFGDADTWRGKTVRGFFRLMRYWPKPKGKLPPKEDDSLASSLARVATLLPPPPEFTIPPEDEADWKRALTGGIPALQPETPSSVWVERLSVMYPNPPGSRVGHEPSCECLYGDYHCTCQ